MEASSALDLMEVDAPSMPTCALNCEALDMALDEIIASAAGKERSKGAAAGQAVSTGAIVFGKKGASRRGRSSAKGGASGGFQKTMLSGTRNRAMKKRGVQAATKNQMNKPGNGMKGKEVYTTKQGSKYQGGGHYSRSRQSNGAGSRVFVNRGQSYVIVAKNNTSMRQPRGQGYQSSRQNRSYTRQNVWRSSVTRSSYQGNMQARGGRMNYNQRTFVQRGWNDNKQENYSNRNGRPRWNDNRRDAHYGPSESHTGLYQPPHRRDEKPNTDQAQPVDFGWGNTKRKNGRVSFGQRSYRDTKNPNQGKKFFSGF